MPTRSGFHTTSFSGTVVNGDNVNYGNLPGFQGEMNAAGKIPIATGVAFPGIQIMCSTLTAGAGISILNGPGSITIGLAGGSVALDSIGVQAVTAPGVSPVLATAGGLVTINGAAVPAQLIPLQSRSIALNSLQLEVQRGSASAATNATQQGVVSFDSSSFTVDANGWVQSLGGSVVETFLVDAFTAPGTNPTVPNGLGVVGVQGAAVAPGLFPVRTNALAVNAFQIQVQRSAASVATNATQQGLSSYNSAQFVVDANGWVSQLNGLSSSSFPVQAVTGPGVSPVLPSALGTVSISGAIVVPSAIPVQSRSIALNSLQLEVQLSSSQALSAVANAGLSSFNSAHFSVDASGWVSNLNGISASAFDVDAFTGPGTDPVLPNASGVVAVSGAQTVAGVNPVRTNSLAANSYQIQVQRSSAQAVSTLTANGICHFDSADFTVDANGFVSSIAGSSPWIDFAGGALVNHTGYFATAAAVYTLPAGVANGDMIEIVDFIGGGVVLTAQGGDLIRIGNVDSSVNGTVTSTILGDALRIVFRAVGQVWVQCPGSQGTWLSA